MPTGNSGTMAGNPYNIRQIFRSLTSAAIVWLTATADFPVHHSLIGSIFRHAMGTGIMGVFLPASHPGQRGFFGEWRFIS